MPNTAELLAAAHDLSATSQHWGVSRELDVRLERAYQYFYPDHGAHFRPDVSDFFTVLSTYNEIAKEGLPQGFPDRELLTDLKFAITKILSDASKVAASGLGNSHPVIDHVIQRGNVVITTNWDLIIERAAQERGVPLRLSGPPSDTSLVLLKLHGSIDWTRRTNCKKALSQVNYACLDNLLFSARSRMTPLTRRPIVRALAIESWSRAYQVVKGSTEEPYMLTMARGKADLIDPVVSIWTDAHRALSSARALNIIGYSMPPDDVEIRTLLRAGYERGNQNPRVTVRNPSPDVHVRIRTQVTRDIKSDYRPVPPIG